MLFIHESFVKDYLGGLGVIQVPKLDMSIPCCNKVSAVIRKRHGCHFTGDFVGSHQYIFLGKDHKKTWHHGKHGKSWTLLNKMTEGSLWGLNLYVNL